MSEEMIGYLTKKQHNEIIDENGNFREHLGEVTRSILDQDLTIKSAASQCMRTDGVDYSRIANHCTDLNDHARIIHGLFGLITEIGELTDVFKKFFYYKKQPDWTNVQEELGDIFWYLCLLLDEVGKRTDEPLDEPIHMVINKLKVRYPEKFLEAKAIERNLEEERIALEESREEIIKRNEDELSKLAAEDLVSEYNEKGN